MNIGVQVLKVSGNKLGFAIVKTNGRSKCGTMPAEIELMTYEPGKPPRAIAKGYFILTESEQYIYEPKKSTIRKAGAKCPNCGLSSQTNSGENSA